MRLQSAAYLAVMQQVHVVECPRDALQGWGKPVDTAAKVDYLRALLAVGFDTLDLGSFVSPRHVPQMADTAAVLNRLSELEAWNPITRRLVIVVNARGAEEACRHDTVDDVGFPLSLSETFSLRNAGMGRDAAWDKLASIREQCEPTGKRLVVYLSMGFGNPYGDPWSLELLEEWMHTCISRFSPAVVSLSDTLGSASPELLEEAFARLGMRGDHVEIGAHLHAHPAAAAAKVEAALRGGCRRFDAAMGGVGGCPFAADALVGNVPTEVLVQQLAASGLWTAPDARAWEHARSSARIVFS